MKRYCKKFLAFWTAVLMLLNVVPVTALAEGDGVGGTQQFRGEFASYTYQVKLDFGGSGVTIPSDVDLYAKVKVNNSQGEIYGHAKITSANTSDGGKTYYATVNQWYNWNGSQSVQIDGNESSVSVTLHALPSGTQIVDPNSLSENNQLKIGGIIQTHEIESYPTINSGYTQDPSAEKPPRIISDGTITDVVYLKKNNDRLNKYISYTLSELLTKYNVITLNGDFTDENHTIGGILVNGNLLGEGGAFTNIGSGEKASAPSAVKGSVPARITNERIQLIGGGQVRSDNGHPRNIDFFVGGSNSVVGNLFAGKFVFPENPAANINTYGRTIVNENFVNWSALQTLMTNSSTAMVAGSREIKTTDVKPGNIIFVTVGEHVVIPDDIYDTKPTIVIIGGSGWNLNDWAQAPGTVITNNSSGSEKMIPLALSTDGGANWKGLDSIENGPGMSIVWNFPKASKVTSNGLSPIFGHVIAPNAEIYTEGPYNGSLVGKSVHTGSSAEGHLWPYRGGSLINTSLTINAGKTVDNHEPEEFFRFVLEELKDVQWKIITKTFNDGSTITFPHTELDTTGTYWYRVYEDPEYPVTGIIPDQTKWVIKSVVSANVVGEDTILSVENTYYKAKKDDTIY